MAINKEILLKRLSVVKLLFRNANEITQQSELTAYLSILSFHDAVDMYLNIAVEHLELKPKSRNETYLKDLIELIPNIRHKSSMLKLNMNRNSIKHNSVSLGRLEVDSAKLNTFEFFNDNTKEIFDFEFEDISLFELLKYEKTKQLLTQAQIALHKGNFDEGVLFSADAFNNLIKDYKENKHNPFTTARFEFTKKVNYSPGSFMEEKHKIEQRLEPTIKEINQNFSNINSALEILALGLDYRKYAKYRAIVPSYFIFDKTANTYNYHSHYGKHWSKENVEFLIDYVIDSALKLQDFEFDVIELQNYNKTKNII